MRIRVMQICLAATLGLLCALVPARAQQSAEAPLTNSAIIKLVRAGFREKTVIALVRTRPVQFDLSPDRLIELKRSGVSENIILNMVARGEAIAMNDEDFDDDPFFNNKTAQAGSQRQSGQGDGATDIFGNSNGSRERTETRGAGNSGSGSSQTTGSATVRILRPPTEAGGAPKLEKTQTLNNDAIIELVEAGFSEGTIVRRIESAPAEFDLSASKLAELRKRRVSDRIIAAMTAAMGDETAKP
jgi:predicted nucleic acid-binding protein